MYKRRFHILDNLPYSIILSLSTPLPFLLALMHMIYFVVYLISISLSRYVESRARLTKLMHRVVHPLELRLFNTTDDSEHPDRIYDLFAMVVHVGPLPNQGHYITIVRSHGLWLLLDDEKVDTIDNDTLESFYGLTDSELRLSKVACGLSPVIKHTCVYMNVCIMYVRAYFF